MKKVICGSIISVSNIGRKIDEYIVETGSYPNFIVMSSATASLVQIDDIIQCTSSCMEFHGVPIAINDGMRIGEYKLV